MRWLSLYHKAATPYNKQLQPESSSTRQPHSGFQTGEKKDGFSGPFISHPSNFGWMDACCKERCCLYALWFRLLLRLPGCFVSPLSALHKPPIDRGSAAGKRLWLRSSAQETAPRRGAPSSHHRKHLIFGVFA